LTTVAIEYFRDRSNRACIWSLVPPTISVSQSCDRKTLARYAGISLLTFDSLRNGNRSFVEKIGCVQSLDSDCDMRSHYQCRQVKDLSRSRGFVGELFQSSGIVIGSSTQGVALGWNLLTPSAFTRRREQRIQSRVFRAPDFYCF